MVHCMNCGKSSDKEANRECWKTLNVDDRG